MSCGTLDTRQLACLRLRDCYPVSCRFPTVFGFTRFVLCRSKTPPIRRSKVWAISSSLAATMKIDVSFSSSGYLDVSVHRVPPASLCIHDTVIRLLVPGFPIRKSAAQSLLTAPRSLSQLTTSFIGSWCQGIHPVLLLA